MTDCDCAVEFVSGASATPLAFVIEISAEMFGERTHRERGGRVGGRRKEEKNRQQAASRSATGGSFLAASTETHHRSETDLV